METAEAKSLSPSGSPVSPATSGPSDPTTDHAEPAEPAAQSPPKPKAHRSWSVRCLHGFVSAKIRQRH